MAYPSRATETRILVSSFDGNLIYAAEFSRRLFLLPFKNINNTVELLDLLAVLTQSILTYKRRNDVYLPQWWMMLNLNEKL